MQRIENSGLEALVATYAGAEPAWLEAVRAQGEALRPGMQLSRAEAQLVGWLLRCHSATRILEIGCFMGYSALSLAQALPHASIVTCERDAQYAALARKHVAASPHAARVTVEEGDALEIIHAYHGPKFDALFVHAEKRRYADYLECALPHLTTDALILADNALLDGEVYPGVEPMHFSREAQSGMRQFLTMLGDTSRFDTAMIPTTAGLAVAKRVGSKPKSGFRPVRSSTAPV